MYDKLFRHVFTRLDPERAHRLAMSAMALGGQIAPVRGAAYLLFGRRGTARPADRAEAARFSEVRARLGGRLRGRVGLAAGLDKDGEAVRMLSAFGFSFLEVGTVTPLGQPGNETPRLWRHLDRFALRNRMGFNNAGAQAMAERLAKLRATKDGREAVVGVNIGKNKVTAPERAADDYRECARALAEFADFLIINVSSPNTPGLRDLQSVAALTPIVQATRTGADQAGRPEIPILVKIAPDLADDDVRAVARFVREHGIAGVVATNTTIAHDYGEGGLSGRPLRERALEVVAMIRAELGPDPIVIGVGGIDSGFSAREMIKAGADLVEVYTGFIYLGPSLPGRINRELASS